MNRVRTEAGLAPAIWPPELAAAAREHSRDMSINSFLGHTGTDGSHPYQRAQRHGWTVSSVGEIAQGGPPSHDAYRIIRIWYNSSGHRAAMLGYSDRAAVVAGVGIYVTEVGASGRTIKFGFDL